ncbi:PREDICTED: auxilin-like protein 1 [Nelumbo nucifera]|uniref:Auxilin-like protein 1 n=2 Tax=Nelumbo nucifera TaxID=4432 RepID=A0A1U8A133_NELNU|nr:PREDICTED: auxilin-like protein 1 [Nelumbo nucifera]DAD40767.1 TPA_asm: hypothetical protein HUJ06_015090 [Nelumbo nucifera]
MEDSSHSHSLHGSQASATLAKKVSNGNGFTSTTVYNDVFGGPPKFGVPTFSSRIEDYNEVFRNFRTSRGSSIPILDLPVVNGADVSFDVPVSKFDYAEIFGGFDVVDFADSYEELFAEPKEAASDEAWTPAETGSLSEGSNGDIACSEKDQLLSNAASDHSVNGVKQCNISHNKANQRNEDGTNGTTHVNQHQAVPAFTSVVDESAHLRGAEGEKLPTQVTDDISFDVDPSVGIMEGQNIRITTSHSTTHCTASKTNLNDFRTRQGSGRNESNPKEVFLTVSEISLKTQPSPVPPPVRQPPKLAIKQGDAIGLMPSNANSSKNCGHEGAAGNISPPFFDVEVDASSAAAASAAAMKEAMEKAQARLKSAKESMERKRDGLQGRMKLGLKDDLKNKEKREGKAAHEVHIFKEERTHETCEREGTGTKDISREEGQKAMGANQVAPDLEKCGKCLDLAKESLEQNHMKGSKSVQQSRSQEDGAGEWKAERQFYELIKTDNKLRVAPETAMEAQEREQGDRKLKTTKEPCRWNGYEKHLKEAYKVHGHEQEESNKKLKQTLEREEHERKLKEANEKEENEKRPKEVCVIEEDKRRLKEACEQVKNEKRLKETFERKENARRLKETHEREENEKELKEAFEREEKEKRLKEACEREEHERKLKEALEREENERRLKEAHEIEENEKRLKEACGKEQNERRLKEAQEREENERILKEAYERKEKERRLKEAYESEENEKRLREAREREEKERRLKDAHEREENERRLREAHEREENEKRLRETLEREENEKKLREAHVREENERRMKEACEREEKERGLKEAHEREEKDKRSKEAYEKKEHERKLKEAQDKEESEKRLKEVGEQEEIENRLKKGFKREENEKRQREACDMEETEKNLIECHEWEENEKRPREGCEQEENLNNQKVPPEQVENGKKLKAGQETHEHKEEINLKATNETCIQNDHENLESIQETCKHEITGKLKAVQEEVMENFGKNVDGLAEEKEWRAANVMNEQDGNMRFKGAHSIAHEYDANENKMKNVTETLPLDDNQKKLGESDIDGCQDQSFKNNKTYQVGCVQENLEGKVRVPQIIHEWEEKGRNALEEKGNMPKVSQEFNTSYNAGRKKNYSDTIVTEVKEKEEMQREKDQEKERLRKIEEEREREREREKDRMAVERATREARERAFADARERAERAAVERATAEARQRAMAEARERLEKASAEAREKSLAEKASIEAKLRAERAAVERATAEARERAVEKAALEARERVERSSAEKSSTTPRDGGLKQSTSDLQNPQFQSSGSYGGSRYPNSSNYSASYAAEKLQGAEVESAQRCKARLQRHQRTVERVAKALAEKNMRDLLAHREQAERHRLAESLDADVKRWSSGKEGNLRALLSTLQYILGPDSGWQPIPLTEVITAAAVKKAYRKATLCVHPDKLQQRGASIQQKYICEKVFDLLKDAWNKFNSEER